MIKQFVGVLILASAPLAAYAGDAGSFSLGIKTGILSPDVDGLDDGTPFGLLAGYSFTDNVSVDFEYLSGDLDYDGGILSGSVDYSSMALFGVFRSSGDVYFLGKAGLHNSEVEDESDTNLALGVGGGVKLGENFSLEAEYTYYAVEINDVDVDPTLLGVTARFSF